MSELSELVGKNHLPLPLKPQYTNGRSEVLLLDQKTYDLGLHINFG